MFDWNGNSFDVVQELGLVEVYDLPPFLYYNLQYFVKMDGLKLWSTWFKRMIYLV